MSRSKRDVLEQSDTEGVARAFGLSPKLHTRGPTPLLATLGSDLGVIPNR